MEPPGKGFFQEVLLTREHVCDKTPHATPSNASSKVLGNASNAAQKTDAFPDGSLDLIVY
jgi:hypothetical protein